LEKSTGNLEKKVTFLNFLKMQNLIEYIVDINPRQQEIYVLYTGKKLYFQSFYKSINWML